ncbi:MAG: DUF1926 domain-containing protein [Alphaproteobacteria bacterium]|nr:DUF1926 domain-containing protein [Alphaproteobacteria bacterium]
MEPDCTALLAIVAVPAWEGPEGVERAWDVCLGPVVEALAAGPGSAALMIGGRLIEEWAKRRPEAVKQLRALLDAGRLELVATAMHRPVLSAVPERDAAAQIAAHTTLLKRILGVRPEGAWIPHGVWDPTLPRMLGKAGLLWTTLDRRWLARVGAPEAPILSVEREGRALDVLPSEPLGVAGSGLRVVHLDEASARAAVAFLPRVSCLPSALLDGGRARAYLPAGGSEGIWECHLLADPGADALHKRMLTVSRLVRRLDRTIGDGRYADDGPDPHVFQQARRYLFRAQATEAYAPTSFGPVHGAHRDRAWRDLLRAERIVHRALSLPECDSVRVDLDCDGNAEARLWSGSWSVTLAPGRGGRIVELSQRDVALNVLSGAEPAAFHERWGDTGAAATWDLVTIEPGGDGSIRGVMCADSAVNGVPVRMTKHVLLPARGPMEVRIDIDNRGMEGVRGMLSTELYATLGGPRLEGEEEASLSVEVAGGKVPLDEIIELPAIEQISIIGWRARIELEPRPAARLAIEPLEQGAARVVLSWPVELWGRERERREVAVNVREEPHG